MTKLLLTFKSSSIWVIKKNLTLWTFSDYYKSIWKGIVWYSWCSKIQNLSELFFFQHEINGSIKDRLTLQNTNNHQINLLGKVAGMLQSHWRADKVWEIQIKYRGQEETHKLELITCEIWHQLQHSDFHFIALVISSGLSVCLYLLQHEWPYSNFKNPKMQK